MSFWLNFCCATGVDSRWPRAHLGVSNSKTRRADVDVNQDNLIYLISLELVDMWRFSSWFYITPSGQWRPQVDVAFKDMRRSDGGWDLTDWAISTFNILPPSLSLNASKALIAFQSYLRIPQQWRLEIQFTISWRHFFKKRPSDHQLSFIEQQALGTPKLGGQEYELVVNANSTRRELFLGNDCVV